MLVPFESRDAEVWTPDRVRAQFVLWGRPSTCHIAGSGPELPAQDMRRACRLVSAAVGFMCRQQNKLFQDHPCMPVLVHYQSDATSYLTRFRKVFGTRETGFTQRGGHDLCEFLSERCFLASVRGMGLGRTEVLIRPPRLLRCGKKAPNHITAMRDIVRLPFASCRQQSVVVISVCFVRAVFDACFRFVQQQHERFWAGAGRLLSRDWSVHRQLDIVVGTCCALHDVASGLRWGTKPFLDAADAKFCIWLWRVCGMASHTCIRCCPHFC